MANKKGISRSFPADSQLLGYLASIGARMVALAQYATGAECHWVIVGHLIT